MKVTLDKKNRKFIEIPVSDENGKELSVLKYFERTTKQIKELKKAAKENESILDIEEKNERQFFENLQGENETINKLIEFYDENGSIYSFMNECDKALGKHLNEG